VASKRGKALSEHNCWVEARFLCVYLFRTKMSLRILDRPFARHILTKLRARETDQVNFRKNLVRLGRIIGYEIADSLECSEVTVETPLGKAKGVLISELDHVVIVNILRAATPLVEGLLKAFPSARQGVVVAKRRESVFKSPPEKMDVDIYYSRVPDLKPDDVVIVADPMLATGSTILRALELVYAKGEPKKVFVASVIASRQGVERVLRWDRPVNIFVVEVDPLIDERGYIVPGLGDAGDRAFG
jgi:uracil phosphoribosyltransferase